jgi:hypothetical protein
MQGTVSGTTDWTASEKIKTAKHNSCRANCFLILSGLCFAQILLIGRFRFGKPDQTM